MSKNLIAFLAMISFSEGTYKYGTNKGYDVLVGGTLFHSFVDHPRITVVLRKNPYLASTAAGRYQILSKYFDVYKKQLGLPDFSPASQDKIAIQLIKECKALNFIEEGHIHAAITKCASRWASFPGAGYNQHENKIHELLTAYENASGTLSEV